MTWEQTIGEMQTAFDALLADSRFAAQSCCLRQIAGESASASGSGYVTWVIPEMDVRGDPTLEFDTGVMWWGPRRLRVLRNY